MYRRCSVRISVCGLRIADVGMGVLHEVNRPALGRKDLRLDRTVAVRRPEREAHPAAVIPLGDTDLHAVQARGELQFATRFSVVAPRRLAGLRVPVGDVERYGMEQFVPGPAVDQRRFGLGREERNAGTRRGTLHRSRSLECHGVKHHPTARNRADREDVVARAERPGRNFDLGAKALRRGFARVEVVLVGACGGLDLRAEVVEGDLEPRGRAAVHLDEVEPQPQCGSGIGLTDAEADQQSALRVVCPGIGGPRDDERNVRSRTAPDRIECRAPGETFRNVGIAGRRRARTRTTNRRPCRSATAAPGYGRAQRPDHISVSSTESNINLRFVMRCVFLCVNVLLFYSASSHATSVIAATYDPVSSVISVPTLSVSGQ